MSENFMPGLQRRGAIRVASGAPRRNSLPTDNPNTAKNHNPNALPAQVRFPDGVDRWVGVHDRRNPNFQGAPGQPDARLRRDSTVSTASTATLHGDAEPPGKSKQKSFFGSLGDVGKIFGRNSKPKDTAMQFNGTLSNGTPVSLKLSRSDVEAYRSTHGTNANLFRYLADRQRDAMRNPMQNLKVPVNLGGAQTSLAHVDLNDLTLQNGDADFSRFIKSR